MLHHCLHFWMAQYTSQKIVVVMYNEWPYGKIILLPLALWFSQEAVCMACFHGTS